MSIPVVSGSTIIPGLRYRDAHAAIAQDFASFEFAATLDEARARLQEPPRHAVHGGQHDGVRPQQRRDMARDLGQ